MPELEVPSSDLSVGILAERVTATVETVLAGSLDDFLSPIPSSYLRTPHLLPQVM